jgi:putative ABC transport system permease protein
MSKSLNRKLLGDLKVNWKQFLAVWVVVTLGVAFYGAFYPAGLNMGTSTFNTYDQLAYMDYQAHLTSAPPSVVDEVRAIPNVAAAEGRLVVDAGVRLDPDHTFLTELRLVSVPDSGEPTVNINDIPIGAPIQADGEILLLRRFAERHGLKPGDSLEVWINHQPHTFRIAGLVFNSEYLVAGRSREVPFPATSSFGVAWLRYSELARLAGAEDQINEIVVRLDPAHNAGGLEPNAAVRQALETTLKDYGLVFINSRIQTASGGVIDANVSGNMPTVIMFSSLFLIGAIAITSVLLGRLVESERQRIGTLRALGVRRGELVWHYTSFGLLIGLTGGLVGSVLGYFLSFMVIKNFNDALAGGYQPGFTNPPNIPFILLGYAIALLGVTLAGAYPAWIAANTPPGIALRPPTPKSPSALSRLPLGFLPIALRQTLRNLLRVPGRSLGAALGVLAGATMIFATFGILNSVDYSFEAYYASGAYDLRLSTTSLVMQADTLETEIKQIDGVSAVQAALLGPVTVTASGHSPFDTVALALDERDPFLKLETLSGAPAFSSADGVWIGHNLARVLDLHIGDRITLYAFEQERETQVLGIVSQVFGSPVFVPRRLMTQWTPGGIFPVNLALVRVQPGQAAEVRDQLAQVPGARAVEDYAQFVSDMREYVQYWRQTAVVFGFFGALLTLAVVLNAVNANLHEQRSELAILRSLGISRREIIVGVTLELLLMAALGIAIGIPLGREIGFYLVHNFDMDFYGILPHIAPVSYWLGAAALLGLVLLAELPGLRAVYQVDLGQVSKSQSI